MGKEKVNHRRSVRLKIRKQDRRGGHNKPLRYLAEAVCRSTGWEQGWFHTGCLLKEGFEKTYPSSRRSNKCLGWRSREGRTRCQYKSVDRRDSHCCAPSSHRLLLYPMRLRTQLYWKREWIIWVSSKRLMKNSSSDWISSTTSYIDRMSSNEFNWQGDSSEWVLSITALPLTSRFVLIHIPFQRYGLSGV